MPYAQVNDVRLYYEQEGQGEPLLLLHGAMGAVDPAVSSSWATLRPALAERYRTFSLEHRGLEQALAMRRCVPPSEVLILNHAGLDAMANHRVQHTRTDVVGPVVLDFLGRHGAASTPTADD